MRAKRVVKRHPKRFTDWVGGTYACERSESLPNIRSQKRAITFQYKAIALLYFKVFCKKISINLTIEHESKNLFRFLLTFFDFLDIINMYDFIYYNIM